MPLYSLMLLGALVLGTPIWLLRMATRGRYRSGLAGRLGVIPAELRTKVGDGPVLWLHAVSVGEVLAATELIRGFRQAYPEWTVAISTTTEAGQAVAGRHYPELAVFYLPLDFAVLVRRYLRVLRPKMLVLMESELWPNLLREARRSGAMVAVVNARISDRSFPRYLRLRRLWRPILEPVSLFLAQSEETATRLRAIGMAAERVRVSGNLKYDVRKADDEGAPRSAVYEWLRGALPVGARLLVAGSTLADEEAQLLGAWPAVRQVLPEAMLLLAPRHVERFAAVRAVVTERGFPVVRVSARAEGRALGVGEVIVLDTIGDLAAVYELAAAAFVGGSLVPAGGHNPLEPARFRVPVMMGPSFYNFREVVRGMQAEDAIRVIAPGDDLSASLLEVLCESEAMRAMGRRGQALFAAQAGATGRTLEALGELLRKEATR